MKKYKYILFTAGRGPVECALAVQGIQDRFKKYLNEQKLSFDILSQKNGPRPRSIETIVFKVETLDSKILLPWIGTLLWICQSPVRKFHKRKNWYIKSTEVFLDPEVRLELKDILVQTFRASGPGGQHRNKVETAVRITHRYSGISVTATDSKSQHQNKKKALLKLEEKMKQRNEEILNGFNADQWLKQLEIERGNPVRTFSGSKFQE